MISVSLAAASICFAGACYPALVGSNTPAGMFTVSRQSVADPGYGGDVLVFQESAIHLWAIHRVYTLNPNEDRVGRLRSSRPGARRNVTLGCINVMPEVYDRLVACCSKDVLVVF
ncbi:MAG TPA: hypothetical protein VIM12_13530 [Noviherbaspirillum sp.]|jgi:hypothetical protein|uniref:hypothetical protein n=1 Tax=Noviherbaspirillum sp. TaxID=1926288 RepID=UPI002F9396E5